jgi:apolipoprotein N-acyltransferase
MNYPIAASNAANAACMSHGFGFGGLSWKWSASTLVEALVMLVVAVVIVFVMGALTMFFFNALAHHIRPDISFNLWLGIALYLLARILFSS